MITLMLLVDNNSLFYWYDWHACYWVNPKKSSKMTSKTGMISYEPSSK